MTGSWSKTAATAVLSLVFIGNVLMGLMLGLKEQYFHMQAVSTSMRQSNISGRRQQVALLANAISTILQFLRSLGPHT